MQFRSITIFVISLLAAADVAVAQVIPFAGQLQINGGPTITFTATAISCSGLTPGDSIVLVGFVRDRQAGSQATTTPTISQQADSNGVFTAIIASGVKARSIWLLVDQSTGGYTVGEPEGSVLRQMPDGTVSPFQGRASAGQATPPATATINRSHTHVIRITSPGLSSLDSRRLRTSSNTPPPPPASPQDIRPPGVTVFDAKDGSDIDGDGTIDGVVNMTFPDSLSIGDYLFVVDVRTLEFRVLVLDNCNLLQECSV